MRLVAIREKHTVVTSDHEARPTVIVAARGPQGPAGPSGGGLDSPILQSSIIIDEDVTLEDNRNGLSVGPVTVADGRSVTVPSTATWMVL